MLKRIENIFVLFIIICSTSFYSLTMLGPLAKGAELLGVLAIVVLLFIYWTYSDQKLFKQQYTLLIMLIFISLFTSMVMAQATREQSFSSTLIAQRAIYYYLFYFLLHQLKIKPSDLEKIFIALGIVHVILYLLQFFFYPKILFDVFMLSDRGTIRIYMKGSDYLVISYFMCIQAFFRTNKIKYLLLTLVFFSIFILLGGRQTMAIMAFVLILFLIYDKKVKSRILLGMLIMACVFLVFIIFQEIFQQLVVQSAKDSRLGADYIRFVSARYFLTDFFKSPLAYITGNGMYSNSTNYGIEIKRLMSHGYYLGDIGLIGNYAIYGIFFIIGVIGICVKSLRARILEAHTYVKYMFIAIVLSLITGGGFVNADFICSITCLLYMIDVSVHFKRSKAEIIQN